ncbi:MAG: hypothetical protein Q8P86_03795 [bacterium]|nr:hypothetical protein [bacterium]
MQKIITIGLTARNAMDTWFRDFAGEVVNFNGASSFLREARENPLLTENALVLCSPEHAPEIMREFSSSKPTNVLDFSIIR